MGALPIPTFGLAWVAFALALAAHVADEALNDFLTTYNASVRAIRARAPLLPLPVFEFRVWLALLSAGIVLLLALSPLAFRGAGWLKTAALPLALVVGLLNAAGHIGSSIWLRRRMPGLYTSPLLLACGVWLIASAL